MMLVGGLFAGLEDFFDGLFGHWVLANLAELFAGFLYFALGLGALLFGQALA